MKLQEIPNDWLVESTNLEKLRSDLKSSDLPDSFREGMLRELEKISADMVDGDEIWKFASPPETWGANCGVSGLAIRRDGLVVVARQIVIN